jgi:pimeloyl-ACP methyl ester carboxylesterase
MTSDGMMRTVIISGIAISFRESGDRNGPAVLLLHGGSSSAATWARLAAALVAAGCHVIAPDLRGHGGSSRTGSYPLAGFCDDIAGLLDALHIGTAGLVGHSLGGYVAAVIARRQPDRITRLVLEEPGLPARDGPDRHELSGPRFLLAALAGLALRRGFDRRAVMSVVRQLRRPDAIWWSGLASITAPTLLVSGGVASHIPPQRLAEVASFIPGSQLVTIPAGHRVHSRDPDQYLAVVVPFLTAGGG